MEIRRVSPFTAAIVIIVLGDLFGWLMLQRYPSPGVNQAFLQLYLFSPLIATAAVWLVTRKQDAIRSLGWTWGGRFGAFLTIGILATMATLLLPLFLDASAGLIPPAKVTATIPALPGILLVAAVGIAYGFAEEAAWRGYLQNALGGRGFLTAAFLVSCAWFFWHAVTLAGGPPAMLLFRFTQLFSLSVIFGIFYLWSGNILVPSLMHAAYNVLAKTAASQLPQMPALGAVNGALAHLLVAGIAYLFYCLRGRDAASRPSRR